MGGSGGRDLTTLAGSNLGTQGGEGGDGWREGEGGREGGQHSTAQVAAYIPESVSSAKPRAFVPPA